MYYAAFGIFTKTSNMTGRGHDARPVGPGTVSGWRLEWRGCADTERCEDETLSVMVWEIDDSTLKSLDVVEGYPRFYTRVRVPVKLPSGYEVEAWMYTMSGKGRLSEPSMGMLHTVHYGHIENGLDEQQIEDAIERARAQEVDHAGSE